MWTRSWLSHHDKKLTLDQPSSSWVETLNMCSKPVLLVVAGGACLTYPGPSLGLLLGEGLHAGRQCLRVQNTTGHVGLCSSLFPALFYFSLSPSSHFDPFWVAFSSMDSPSHHAEIRRLFPQAQMQTVPNAGHWIHADCPQDFVAAIRGFLA